MKPPVFRFAPSPTGLLHSGHAYAALVNQKICNSLGGTMLLRMENTDFTRCKESYEAAIIEDLQWLGFEWQGEIRRQSQHVDLYRGFLNNLLEMDLVYPAILSRGEIKQWVRTYELSGLSWPHDPDGAPFYPGKEHELNAAEKEKIRAEYEDFALRLDMKKALAWLDCHAVKSLTWQEFSTDKNEEMDIPVSPEKWGDVVLGRKHIIASYHLACVIDDHAQGITHVVRGKDLYQATSIHRLLQELLGFSPPKYCHHELITDSTGKKLAKRHGDTSIQSLRQSGMSQDEFYNSIGLKP